MVHQTVAAAVLAMVLAGPGAAQTVTETAREIEARIETQDFAGALADAQAMAGRLWDMTTAIGFAEAVLVDQPASDYGIYNPRAGMAYKLGDPIYVYAEPVGYGYAEPGIGLFSIGFFVDLTVLAEDGALLGEMQNVVELDQTARARRREFQTTITYNLGGIAPGRYVLVTTFRDKNSPKAGSFETPIEILP